MSDSVLMPALKLDKTVITFFDLASNLPGQAYSPSTWKTSYALNLKKLPFHTYFVDFIDTQTFGDALSSLPLTETPKKDPRRQIYTLPMIYDPHTNRAMCDSLCIAQYLEATYPAPTYPPLIKQGDLGFTIAFERAIYFTSMAVTPLVGLAMLDLTLDSSRAYFRKTREAWLGGRLEHVTPRQGDPEWEEAWRKGVEEPLSVIDGWYAYEDESGRGEKAEVWLRNGQISYPDFVVAAYVMWLKSVWGEESENWKEAKCLNGGRWGRLLEACRPYEGSISLGKRH